MPTLYTPPPFKKIIGSPIFSQETGHQIQKRALEPQFVRGACVWSVRGVGLPNRWPSLPYDLLLTFIWESGGPSLFWRAGHVIGSGRGKLLNRRGYAPLIMGRSVRGAFYYRAYVKGLRHRLSIVIIIIIDDLLPRGKIFARPAVFNVFYKCWFSSHVYSNSECFASALSWILRDVIHLRSWI